MTDQEIQEFREMAEELGWNAAVTATLEVFMERVAEAAYIRGQREGALVRV